MLKINMKDIKKYYGTRLILEIEELKIHKGDKTGVVGVNGSGKTTLLEIIAGITDYECGELLVKKDTTIKYISQLGGPDNRRINGRSASIFQVEKEWNKNMSGGEKTRFKLAEGFENLSSLMLIDEPTSNLDMDGIELITNNFLEYGDTYLVVSHDRDFLDKVCNQILEIENGRVKLYRGNYSKYKELKQDEVDRKEFEYQEYVSERTRLLDVKRKIQGKSSGITSPPSRMGNSEARLHKMGGQKAKKSLDKHAKTIQSRIDHLEAKEKPLEEDIIRIRISDSSKPYSKILISGEHIDKSYGKNILFKDANFDIYNGKKIGLIGPNGSGKTTLINMILKNEKVNININKNVKIGYFSQSMNILNERKTILENAREDSIHNENLARLILGRLLIKGDKVHKKLQVLSGGERVKVSFAKIILQDINFLILDEPTNYLDINSLEVVEELLKNFEGTILLVSHDRRFIENIVDELLIIKDKKIKNFKGTWSEYLKFKDKAKLNTDEKKTEESKMILKMEISTLISKISLEENKEVKKELDHKYQKKLKELGKL